MYHLRPAPRWILARIVPITLIVGCLELTGCALHEPVADPATPPAVTQCRHFYAQLQAAVTKAGVTDVQSAPIQGLPYLYTNRFLSSLRQQPMTEPQFEFWLDQLQQLGQETWEIQSANLPMAAQQALLEQQPAAWPKTWPQALAQCAQTLRQHDLQTPPARQALQASAITPDSYSSAARVFGLYPLTKHAMYAANQRSREKFTEAYLTRLEALPVKGKLVRYTPPAAPPSNPREVEALLKLSALNPLQLPLPQGAERERLFAIFAPVWEIDVAHHRDDHIGRPLWPSTLDLPDVDPNEAVIYTKIAHTRFQGETLLQLVYTAWFPARTQHQWLDIEAGRFSGVMWRVTLKNNGEVLLYDSAHSCACYHMFYPVAPELQLGKLPADPAEQVFQPQRQTAFPQGNRLVLRIAHLSHALHRVYPLEAKTPDPVKKTIPYQLADYEVLRSLPYADGHRSLFDENGMVPGSERLAGRLFWMMGVHIIGSMRQWGNHATAFTGHRHFDDPAIFEKLYRVVEIPATEPETTPAE